MKISIDSFFKLRHICFIISTMLVNDCPKANKTITNDIWGSRIVRSLQKSWQNFLCHFYRIHICPFYKFTCWMSFCRNPNSKLCSIFGKPIKLCSICYYTINNSSVGAFVVK